MARQILCAFICEIFTYVPTIWYTVICARWACFGFATVPEKYCRKAFLGLRWDHYCIATAAPLDDGSGLVTTPGRPYGKKNGQKMTFKKIGKFNSETAVKAPLGGFDGRKWCFGVRKCADFG